MQLARYIAGRLLLLLPVLFGTSVLIFLLLRLIPGDPAQVILGLRATPERLVIVRSELGLDLPIHQQYAQWLGKLLAGDLGKDFRSNEAVSELLRVRLPVTIELTLFALALAIVVAVPLGIRAAIRPGGLADRAAMLLGLLGISIPDFWLGIMLILLFSLGLRMFPSSGYVRLESDLVGNLRSFFLPALTLAVGLAAVLVRMTRAALLEVLERDFVKFLRAKGLRERLIIYQHVLRNASIPIVTVIGLQFGYLLGGAVIVEEVFSLPGVGRLIVSATLERNYPVVQAGMLVVALLFILVNLATDVLYGLLNPKIRGDGA
ncbi:MAG: ABC transporter permease [Chloroflexi bacterium]|nr:ABC transporter permease [Chloroflexota bacterium]